MIGVVGRHGGAAAPGFLDPFLGEPGTLERVMLNHVSRAIAGPAFASAGVDPPGPQAVTR